MKNPTRMPTQPPVTQIYSPLAKAAMLLLAITIGAGNLLAQIPTARRVTIVASCEGESSTNSHLTIRWGHPDFHQNEYFNPWQVKHATEDKKEFELPDKASEFEIQTEGGKITSYNIQISINGRAALSLKFDKDANVKEFKNLGVVHTQRSSDLNAYGEGNIRIHLTMTPNEGAIPDKKQ